MKKIIIMFILGLMVSYGYSQKGSKPLRTLRSPLVGGAIHQIMHQPNKPHIVIGPQGPIRPRPIKPIVSPTLPLPKPLSAWDVIPPFILYERAQSLYAKGDSVLAIQYLRIAARKRYAPAQYDYGRRLVMGKGVEIDMKQGWQLIQKAAEQKDSMAMFELGREFYYDNYLEYLPKDTIKGFDWMKKAADAGFLPAQLQIGTIYLVRTDTINAIKYYTMADDIGWDHRAYVIFYGEYYNSLLRDADVILGNYYYNDEEGSKDIDAAIKYWSHAAHFGHGEAAYHVGFLLLEGTEVEQNLKLGITYMEMAACSGCTEAQAYYGDCYMNSIGVERDSLRAIEWWKKAGEAGHAGAQYCLTCNYYMANDNDSTIYWGEKPGCRDSSLVQYCVGMAYYCKDNTEEAKNWWEKAAGQNQPDACWGMACIEWENDSITAFLYLRKAADLGHPDAINDMGFMYLNGYIVEKDINKAINYFKSAADAGYVDAYSNLGIIYYWKEYGLKDRRKAAEYWRRGAELGTPDCQYYYGYILKKGHGVKKDKQEAIRWYKLAAQNGSEEAKEELQKMGINVEQEPVLDTSNTVNTIKEEPQPTMKQYRVTGVDFIGVTLEEE